MSAPDDLSKLIEKFDRDKPGSETELRIQFVDPLFEALGWDPRDRDQVRHETSVIIEEAGLERKKKPDYSFHIGNARHFFVETKMPHINLERNRIPAYQLRRYGWNGKTPVSVLTDFEEFSVYDCRIEPEWNDPANKARLRYYHYGDYIDKWDELESRFSREAVAGGALREWVEGERIRGAQSVDQSFLSDMEEWRAMLAKAIALHNRDLSQRQLNLLVQRTLDRIVFLRIAEDRDIEAYRRLRSAADDGKQVYEELKILFNEADDKYNSGLFHFGKEKRASDPDHDSLRIHIPDEPLREIIRNLYFPSSPYEFSVMSAEILGQVYEQFLGKVIELSASGAVRVEEKPEVRKAGGVYYTPAYIVDYIVENTVGALLKGKTPADAEKLRILDPACGSGSFLVGAYQYLLDWHLATYSRAPARNKNVLRRIVGGYLLTTAEKRRILQNNIYGVDLDQNAVEVSKLSLLLKMLENESDAAGRQTLMFSAGGRILPDLSDNIKWGNSLIGSDFFRGPQAGLFVDEEAMLKVKAFDWDSDAGFGDIMRSGGFDAVIGNPPYVSMLILDKVQEKSVKPYWKKMYFSAAGAFDIYVLFVEKGITLLTENGLLGFIVPNKFLAAEYAIKFRQWLLENSQFVSLTDYSRVKVWDISVYPMIPILRKANRGLNDIIRVFEARSQSNQDIVELPHKESNILDKIPDNIWSFLTQQGADILIKALRNSTSLDDVSEVYGSATVAEGSEYPRLIHEGNVDTDDAMLTGYSRFVVSGTVFRYMTKWETDRVKFTRQSYNRPLISLASPMPERRIRQAQTSKLMICKVALGPRAFLDLYGEYAGAYVTYVFKKTQTLHYLCGIINSKLMAFLFRLLYDALAMGGGYLRFQPPQMRRVPIRTIDFTNPEDVQMHDEMVKLVDEMLDLHKQLPNSTGEGRRITEALIETVDNEIDALVYKLYGLSEDEVAIVEGG